MLKWFHFGPLVLRNRICLTRVNGHQLTGGVGCPVAECHASEHVNCVACQLECVICAALPHWLECDQVGTVLVERERVVEEHT